MKKFIPEAIKPYARASRDKFKQAGFYLMRRFPVLGALYYATFSAEFRREQGAVLAGRAQYIRELSKLRSTSALLRRNTHRLEKGLIMRPRRAVFGANYIVETVTIFRRASEVGTFDPDELQWSFDVISAFFDAVQPGQNAIVDNARSIFEGLAANKRHEQRVPYQYDDLPPSEISFEQLEVLFRRRRSVRWFDGRPVSAELLNQAVRIASYAPSACNRLPYQFVVANGPELAPRLAALANGTPGWAENIPCTIAVVGDLSAYFAERDRHLIYIDGALASMQFMQACDTLGLATCPINWPDIKENETAIRELLDLSASQRTIMLIAVGYADPEGLIPYSEKKKPASLMRFLSSVD